MFKKIDNFGVLKGKAAEVRSLVKPLQDVCRTHLDARNRVHQQISLALAKLVDIEAILKTHRSAYVLPDADARRFRKACNDFCSLNALLRRHFEGEIVDGRAVMLFHVTIRFHYMLHIADIALYINPRLGWCYQGESLMHRVRILVQSSCHGVPPHLLGDKVLKKYAMALAMLSTREAYGGEF